MLGEEQVVGKMEAKKVAVEDQKVTLNVKREEKHSCPLIKLILIFCCNHCLVCYKKGEAIGKNRGEGRGGAGGGGGGGSGIGGERVHPTRKLQLLFLFFPVTRKKRMKKEL